MSETLEPALPDHLDEQAGKVRSLKVMLDMLDQALASERESA